MFNSINGHVVYKIHDVYDSLTLHTSKWLLMQIYGMMCLWAITKQRLRKILYRKEVGISAVRQFTASE